MLSGAAKYRSILLLALLSGTYLLVNRPFSGWGGGVFLAYVVQPLLWAAAAVLVWLAPRARAAGKLRLRRLLCWLALICAGFHIVFLLAGGLAEGFGKSPYSFTPLGILTNIFFVVAMLAGTELSRAFLINNLAGRRVGLTLALASLFFTVIGLPLSKITVFKSNLDFIKFVGAEFLPGLSENLLASYLAYLGGPLPALIYRGALEAFQWFCPVLPDLGWTTKTMLGFFIPIFSLILVQRLYQLEARGIRKSGTGSENPAGWLATSVVSVLMVWFAVGLFPVYPTVILSGSMEPGIKKGDVVLIKKMPGEKAKAGDVIQFRHENIMVLHRVIGVEEKDGRSLFRTKGDANKSADSDPVQPDQVKGRLVSVIPKAGWAALVLKTFTGGISPQGKEFYQE